MACGASVPGSVAAGLAAAGRRPASAAPVGRGRLSMASLGPVSERSGWDDDLLPEQTADDTDRGWGDDDRDPREDADLERLRREKPPHW